MSGTIAWRLRIHDPALGPEATFRAGPGVDLLVVTSLPSGPNPFITAPPDGDGQSLDLLTGAMSVGSYTVRVADEIGTVSASDLRRINWGDYADLSGFTESDPDSSFTWDFNASHILTSPKALHAHGVGVLSTGSYVSTESIPLTGLEPSTTYEVFLEAYFTTTTPGLGLPALNQWVTQQMADVVTDGAGNGTLVITTGVSGAGPYDYHKWIDNVRLIGPGGTTEARVVTAVLFDAEGKLRVNSRAANVEETTDGGASWPVLVAGYLNHTLLDTGITYALTIGESQRVQQTTRVFEVAEPGFERVSCILGGPIVGDFGPMRDEGRPRFTVVDTSDPRFVTLRWTGGQIHAGLRETSPGLLEGNREYLADLARPYLLNEPVDAPSYPGLRARLLDIETAAGIVENPPAGFVQAETEFIPRPTRISGAIQLPGETALYGIIGRSDNGRGSDEEVSLYWPAAGTNPNGVPFPPRPSVGARFKMIVYPIRISERNPLHWTGHIVDFALNLQALKGQSVDPTSAGAVKDAIGDAGQVELRITQTMTLAQALATIAYGPFGFAARQTKTGLQEFLRIRGELPAPTETITLNDLADPGPVLWETAEETAVTKIRLVLQAFSYQSGRDAADAIDYLVSTDQPIEALPDPAVYDVFGDHPVTYELPGRLLAQDPILFATEIGRELFRLQGRGAMQSEFRLLRGAIDAQVGDLVILDIDVVPTADAP